MADTLDQLSALLAACRAQRTSAYKVGHDRWHADVAVDFENNVIARFLAPTYTVTRDSGGAVDARLFTDPEMVARAHHLWRHANARMECGGMNDPQATNTGCEVRSRSLAPGIRIVSGRYQLRSRASSILTLVEGVQRWIFFQGEEAACQFDAARAVRALLAAKARISGAVAVHGACFAVDGLGYLLCGAKRAGKTTNLFAALQNVPGAAFVANDRVYLHRHDTGISAYGSPHSIPVRLPTLLQFPALTKHLGKGQIIQGGASRGYTESVELTRTETRPQPSEAREVFISSGELTEAFGVDEVIRCRLAGAIHLLPLEETTHQGWQRQESKALADVVRANLHPRIETNFSYWDEVFDDLPRPYQDLSDCDGVAFWTLNSWAGLSEAWRRSPIARN